MTKVVFSDGTPTRAIANALRDPSQPPSSTIAADPASAIAAASHHRVLLLLGSHLRAAGTLGQWPSAFVDAFHTAEHVAVAEDLLRQREIASLLRALTAAGVRVLLFKGAAVAYTHYAAPYVRVRADTDLLIAESELSALEDVLDRLGYVRPAETSGRLVSYQSHYHKTDRYGVTHALDVHWRVSNVQSIASRFDHEELWRSRAPVPALGDAAWTVDAPFTLVLALVHRAAHHPGSTNLLWIYDLHQLSNRATTADARGVHEMAADRGLAPIAADGLSLAHDLFGSSDDSNAARLIASLRAVPARRDDVPILDGSLTQAGILHLDLRALPTWRARARLLREHLLPPAAYMRARYSVRSNTWLPAFYVWRVLHGAPRWLVPRPTDSQ